jgi:hypothetical protein
MESDAEKKPRQILDMARNYRAIGRGDRASQKYADLVAAFPDSVCAHVGRAEMAGLESTSGNPK